MPNNADIIEKNPRAPGRLLTALLVTPAVLFYGIVVAFYTGLPVEDDYNGLFGFAVEWHRVADVGHRLLMIITHQHNEYKMPLLYSLFELELASTHRFSIPFWIWVGNLLALFMLAPLWRTCEPEAPLRKRLVLFVPVVWIVMSLNYAETLNFALSGMQVVLVIVLSLASLFFITRPSVKANYLGCLFALLACMTYANAFLLAPVGIPLLWFKGRKKVFAVWVAVFAIALATFLYRYTFLPHPQAGLISSVIFFFTVVGCPFGFHGIYVGSTICGLMMIILLAYFAWLRADQMQSFAFWASVWLVLGCMLVTYGRASFGLRMALMSRYKIYSDLLLAMLYLQAVALMRARKLPAMRHPKTMPAVIVLAVLFGLGSDALGVYRFHATRMDGVYGMRLYCDSGGAMSPMLLPPESPDNNSPIPPAVLEYARTVLTESMQDGLYRPPPEWVFKNAAK